MLLLKWTAGMQQHIGLPKKQLLASVDSDAPLGQWMLNRFPIERREAFFL